MKFSRLLFNPSKLNFQYLNSEMRPVSIAVWFLCSALIIGATAFKPIQAITNLNPALTILITLPHFILVISQAVHSWITGIMYRPVWTMISIHVNLLVVFPGTIIAAQSNPMTPMWAAYLFYVAVLLNAIGFQIYMLLPIMFSGMVPWLFYLVVKPELADVFLPVCITFSILGFIEYLFIGVIVSRSRQMLLLEERLAHEQRQYREIRQIWNDIHDGIGSHLTMAILSNGVALKAIDKENPDISHSRQLICESADNLSKALCEMQEAVRFSNDSVECTPVNLADYLRHKFTAAFDLKNIFLTISIDDSVVGRKFNPATAHAIRRITQESLTNILRHSNATRAEVLFRKHNKNLEIVVEDNGNTARFDNDRQGSGLEIMRRRAQEIGADMEIRCTDTGSVMVQLQIPQM